MAITYDRTLIGAVNLSNHHHAKGRAFIKKKETT